MTLFLSGPMGAGKSTLGRALGGRFVDLDAALEARHGASVAELFARDGEPAFRARERALALEVADERPDVVALGGGTVLDRETRRALLARGTLVTLTASPDVLAGRLAGDRSRPLLEAGGSDRAATLARLIEARRDAYAECHDTLDTGHVPLEALAAEARALVAERALVMPLGQRSYRLHVGPGVRARLGRELDALRRSSVGAASGLVVVADTNTEAHARALDVSATRVTLPAGEAEKTIRAVESVWDAALAAGIDRRALVLAVGGGVIGDVAGFAAATLLRGVRVAQIPTTLLAMVDASIGGKTGVDRAGGKNLVGAFHQPSFVLADLDTLGTLPARERTAGLAEVVKAAWLTGEADVAALERDASRLRAGHVDALEPAIRRAVATKIAIVSADEEERGVRAHLNLGHTFGHAIESASGYTRTHGECVALGLVAAMRVGVQLGDATNEDAARMTGLLDALGLPTEIDAHLDARLAPHLAADKKRDAGAIRFVVPGGPGSVRLEPLTVDRALALAGAHALPS